MKKGLPTVSALALTLVLVTYPTPKTLASPVNYLPPIGTITWGGKDPGTETFKEGKPPADVFNKYPSWVQNLQGGTWVTGTIKFTDSSNTFFDVWYQDNSKLIDIFTDNPVIDLEFPLTMGSTWKQTVSGGATTLTSSVVSTNSTISTPMGQLSNVVIVKTSNGLSAPYFSWYAPGMGLVAESNNVDGSEPTRVIAGLSKNQATNTLQNNTSSSVTDTTTLDNSTSTGSEKPYWANLALPPVGRYVWSNGDIEVIRMLPGTPNLPASTPEWVRELKGTWEADTVQSLSGTKSVSWLVETDSLSLIRVFSDGSYNIIAPYFPDGTTWDVQKDNDTWTATVVQPDYTLNTPMGPKSHVIEIKVQKTGSAPLYEFYGWDGLLLESLNADGSNPIKILESSPISPQIVANSTDSSAGLKTADATNASISVNGSTYLSLDCIEQSLKSVGISYTWDGQTFNIKTLQNVNQTNTNPPSDLVTLSVNGTVIDRVKGVLVPNSETKASTMYLPVTSLDQVLKRAGIYTTFQIFDPYGSSRSVYWTLSRSHPKNTISSATIDLPKPGTYLMHILPFHTPTGITLKHTMIQTEIYANDTPDKKTLQSYLRNYQFKGVFNDLSAIRWEKHTIITSGGAKFVDWDYVDNRDHILLGPAGVVPIVPLWTGKVTITPWFAGEPEDFRVNTVLSTNYTLHTPSGTIKNVIVEKQQIFKNGQLTADDAIPATTYQFYGPGMGQILTSTDPQGRQIIDQYTTPAALH